MPCQSKENNKKCAFLIKISETTFRNEYTGNGFHELLLYFQVKMTDINTKKEMVFSFNRWLSRELDDGDMVRELPVSMPGKEPLPGEL